MATKRYTDADRARVLQLHANGSGRNDIRRATGYGAGFITTTVHAEGKSFERSAEVAVATKAKQADNKVRRAIIVGRLYEQTERILDILDEPEQYRTIMKAEQGREVVATPGFIPSADRRQEHTSIGIALDKAVRLEQVDATTETSEAQSMLGRLAEQLGVKNVFDASGQPEATGVPEGQ